MFDPKNAAKERAKAYREAAEKGQEQLDRTRADLRAGREKGVYTADAITALEDVVALEQMRMLQLTALAEQYEAVSRGERAFAP